METWDEIKRWRRARREELIGRRQALPQSERRGLQARIISHLEAHFPGLAGGSSASTGRSGAKSACTR